MSNETNANCFLKVFNSFKDTIHEFEKEKKEYEKIIKELEQKINTLNIELNISEKKYIELKDVYEQKMFYLLHINNTLRKNSVKLHAQLNTIENESIFTKIKKSVLLYWF